MERQNSWELNIIVVKLKLHLSFPVATATVEDSFSVLICINNSLDEEVNK